MRRTRSIAWVSGVFLLTHHRATAWTTSFVLRSVEANTRKQGLTQNLAPSLEVATIKDWKKPSLVWKDETSAFGTRLSAVRRQDDNDKDIDPSDHSFDVLVDTESTRDKMTFSQDEASLLMAAPTVDTTASTMHHRISYTDAGTLQLEFPATGITSSSVMTGAFAASWWAALVPATTMVTVPILLPFYLAGGVVTKLALVEPFTSKTLSIGAYAWSLDVMRYGKRSRTKASGPSAQISHATVVERRQNVHDDKHKNQPTMYRYIYDLQLVLHSNNGNFSSNRRQPSVVMIQRAMESYEQARFLANTINQQLATLPSFDEDLAIIKDQ